MSAVTVLIGNTTADVEIRYTQGGKVVGNLVIAVADRKFDRERNEWVDGDVWFARCTLFGDVAEHAAASVPKGTRVIASGRIVQRSWEDKEGQRRSSVEVVLDEIGPSLRFGVARYERGGGQTPNAATTGAGNQGGGDAWAFTKEPWSTPATSGDEPF